MDGDSKQARRAVPVPEKKQDEGHKDKHLAAAIENVVGFVETIPVL